MYPEICHCREHEIRAFLPVSETDKGLLRPGDLIGPGEPVRRQLFESGKQRYHPMGGQDSIYSTLSAPGKGAAGDDLEPSTDLHSYSDASMRYSINDPHRPPSKIDFQLATLESVFSKNTCHRKK